MTKESYFLVVDQNGDEYFIEASIREAAIEYFHNHFPDHTIVRVRRVTFFKGS